MGDKLYKHSHMPTDVNRPIARHCRIYVFIIMSLS